MTGVPVQERAAAAVRPAARPLRSALLAPRSLALLLLAFVIAATCAGLAQWQVGRAVDRGTVVARQTERVRPLSAVATPASQQTTASIGQRVSTRGRLVPQDVLVVGDRLQHGRRGWWVVGHAVVDRPAGAQLAVALGWTPDRATAERAAAAERSAAPADGPLQGRYVDSDGAEPSTSGSPTALTAVSTARLVNLWDRADTGPVYEGVLTLESAPAGLTAIYSPTPGEQVELNLLNVFYAGEWVLFAGASFYIWYRLVKDRWELDQQEASEGAEGAAAAPSAAGRS